MSRFSLEEADKIIKQGSGFFMLRDHGDKALVRFLYGDASDVEGIQVHTVRQNGKLRNVECLKSDPYDSNDVCPLCAAGHPIHNKFYIPLYDIEGGEVRFWERGASFKSKLAYLCNEYSPVYGEVFEIMRQGAAGDSDTKYSITCVTDEFDEDDPVLDFDINAITLPNVSDEESGILLVRSKEDLQYYAENRKFEDDIVADDQPQRVQRDQGNYSARGSRRESSYSSNNRYSTRVGQTRREF